MPVRGIRKPQKNTIKTINYHFGEDIRNRHWCIHKKNLVLIKAEPGTGQKAYEIKITRIITYLTANAGGVLLINQDVLLTRTEYRSCQSNRLCFQEQGLVVNLKVPNVTLIGKFFSLCWLLSLGQHKNILYRQA